MTFFSPGQVISTDAADQVAMNGWWLIVHPDFIQQQYIQNKLIDTAKEVLSTTSLSVSEIAYQLGFEYPQSFSKLFKNKTNVSPLEFRQSFN
uniref:helix-turn-helix domain-containing protein n=1 Tax=Fibrisoma montanum TaxID=2305895 RepID=UPI0026D7B79C